MLRVLLVSIPTLRKTCALLIKPLIFSRSILDGKIMHFIHVLRRQTPQRSRKLKKKKLEKCIIFLT